jgi:glycosyltransferase involved in cell wall biosynthesis
MAASAATPGGSGRPALSVIMPAYNAGRFLGPAIESVLNQTWRDFEFIIIDDASIDGTRERIEEYAARDPRIRNEPNPVNLGVTRTLNRAIGLARGDWIARMDADDISYPQRFERQMALARGSPSVGLVTSPFDIIDADERRRPGWRGICFQRETLPFFLLFYNRLNAHGQVMYSTALVRELGGYREGYHLSEATELWIRMIHATRFAVVPEPLYAWRAANPNSVTKQNTFRYAEDSLRACRESIARTCGIEVSREQMVALRDFWLRFPAPQNWAALEQLLATIAQRYLPPRTIPGWRRRVAIALAGAWLGHAMLEMKHRRWRSMVDHLRRAARASGVWLPLATAQFARELMAVGGQVTRRL